MKPQGHSLVFGMHDNDVGELQRDLARLGLDILSQEITGGGFGETTRAGVQIPQKQNRLEPDGVVDIKTVGCRKRCQSIV
jgi:peptidoglycan hydrolase-like protein with peptidoglycan-binding domain